MDICNIKCKVADQNLSAWEVDSMCMEVILGSKKGSIEVRNSDPGFDST
jgi:hypothetical protein